MNAMEDRAATNYSISRGFGTLAYSLLAIIPVIIPPAGPEAPIKACDRPFNRT